VAESQRFAATVIRGLTPDDLRDANVAAAWLFAVICHRSAVGER